ncbi:hypothetical protein DRH27_03880, partial [Candidatus Falkowbacteria bacterium]
MKKSQDKKRIKRKLISSFLIVFLTVSFFVFVSSKEADAYEFHLPGFNKALSGIKLLEIKSDPKEKQTIGDIAGWIWEKTWENSKLLYEKYGSAALQGVIRNGLNKIAYDTATWLGSGGKGQKPLFITEGWGEYLGNIVDQAGGEYIERQGREGGFNFCKPDLSLKLKLGLALVQHQRPKEPACTFSEMTDRWSEELKSGDFLNRFQDMFDPVENNLGAALILQTDLLTEEKKAKDIAALYRVANQGWLSVRNLAGKSESAPSAAELRQKQATGNYIENWGEFTGDALTDAANVFLNQLAMSLFNKFLSTLGKDVP